MKNKLQNHKKERENHKKMIDKEFNMLNKESAELKIESERILLCGVGDQDIVNRVQAHLNKIKQFFQQQVSQINTTNSNSMPLEQKTFLLEHLETLFILTNYRMDKWLDLLIDVE